MDIMANEPTVTLNPSLHSMSSICEPMKRTGVLFALFLAASAGAQTYDIPPVPNNEPLSDAIGFWENLGQVKSTAEDPQPDVTFYSQGAVPRAFMRTGGQVSFVLGRHDTLTTTPDTLHRLDMSPTGEMAQEADPVGEMIRTYHENYYLPWTGGGVEEVRGYNYVVYEDWITGIDLLFFSGRAGQKMAFVCHPGSDPEVNLQVQFDGYDQMHVEPDGTLQLLFGDQWVELREAVAYQYDANDDIDLLNWTAEYDANTSLGITKFTFSSYDPDLPLVLLIGPPPLGGGGPTTPGLCWSTYFGADQRDDVQRSCTDAANNYYVAGSTSSDFLIFPEAPGTEFYANAGGLVSFVYKVDQNDVSAWRVFYGGQGNENTVPGGLLVKEGAEPMVYMAGTTNATTLDVLSAGTAYYDGASTSSLNKGFIAKFSVALGERFWSTYFGETDLLINGMALGDQDRIYLCGRGEGSLPVVQDTPPTGSLNRPYGGGQDGFGAMLNADDRLQWISWFDGEADDAAFEVVTHENKVVFAGITESSDFYTYDGGSVAWDHAFSGELGDAWVAELDLDCVPQWISCYGADQSQNFSTITLGRNALAIDPITGDVIIAGYVLWDGLNIVPGPGWFDYTSAVLQLNGFVARFSHGARELIWSSYISGSEMVDIQCAYVDPLGNLFLAGRTRDLNLQLPSQPGIYHTDIMQQDLFSGFPENSDAFLLCFAPGNWLAYGSYFGGNAGNSHEYIFSILRRNGNIYTAGYTSKPDGLPLTYFPLHDTNVPGVYFQEFYGDATTTFTSDGFIAVFCADVLTGIEVFADDGPAGVAWETDEGALMLAGLPRGRFEGSLHDAAGRAIVSFQAISAGGGLPSRIPIPPLAEGLYVVSLPEAGWFARFVHTR